MPKYPGRIALLCVCVCMLVCKIATAQQVAPKEEPQTNIKDLRLIKEESDGKGHIVRIIQYNRGNIRVTETIYISKEPLPTGLVNSKPIKADTLIKDQIEIVVSKSQYRVGVYYRNRLIRSYKAVFGPNPGMNKCMEGDRCTPEGTFRIAAKNGVSKYNKFMLLNYPNDSATVRFARMKAEGKIPASAKIGGAIGIHGIWKGGDDMIEMGVGWTDGCVAIKNHDIEELYSLVGVGTKVSIRK